MVWRVVLVEDSLSEAEVLESHLMRYGSEHDLEFEVMHYVSALEYLDTRPLADLILMDIDLPGLTGMQAAEELRSYDAETPLMFVTNLAQYAVEGYNVDAIDFMVKPVSYYDFQLRMRRALRYMERFREHTCVLTDADGTHIVHLKDIAYIDIYKHDLFYHVRNRDAIRIRGTISSVDAQFADKGFVKISSSCVINMARVVQIKTNSVVLDTQDELFFSRSRKREALTALTNYLAGSI